MKKKILPAPQIFLFEGAILSVVKIISVVFIPVFKMSNQIGVITTEISHLKEGQNKLERKIENLEAKFDNVYKLLIAQQTNKVSQKQINP